MRRALCTLPGYAIFALLIASCGSTTEPLHDDIDRALLVWNEMDAHDYTFEVAIRAFVSSGGFYRVRVENKQVVEAFDENGAPAQGFNRSLHSIWDDILSARARGEVNLVRFNRLGVPIETDIGEWALDSGVHYSVRSFTKLR